MIRRSLTEGEIALARSVFADKIKYADVTVMDGKYFFLQARGVSMAPNGHLYMHDCYCRDYSAESSALRGHFIHEMTHVWQYQNKIFDPRLAALKLCLKHKFNYAASYFYKLDANRDFLSYGMEQQASIIQDYFLNCRENLSYRGHCENKCSPQEKARLYEKLLARFLKP